MDSIYSYQKWFDGNTNDNNLFSHILVPSKYVG